jgi:hypothetical protein
LHYCHRKTFSRAIGKERIRLPVAWYTALAAATPIDAEEKGFANGWDQPRKSPERYLG